MFWLISLTLPRALDSSFTASTCSAMDSDSPPIISFTVCEAVRICSIAACDPFNKERVLRIYAALTASANDRPLSRKYVSLRVYKLSVQPPFLTWCWLAHNQKLSFPQFLLPSHLHRSSGVREKRIMSDRNKTL